MGIFYPTLSLAEIQSGLAGSRVFHFYGLPTTLSITGTAVTRALASVTLPNLSTLPAILYASIGIIIHGENQDGANPNKTDAIQNIQCDIGAAGWLSGLTINSASLMTHDGEGGFWRLQGNIDVKAKVLFNGVTDFQWLNTKMDHNFRCQVYPFIEVIV